MGDKKVVRPVKSVELYKERGNKVVIEYVVRIWAECRKETRR